MNASLGWVRFLAACACLVIAVLCFCHPALATDVYVSPAGNDTNSGNQAEPVATLARARDIARMLAGKEPVTIQVADGTYYLPETLVLSAADSGTREHPVIYRAQHDGGAVLSGGSKLELKWKPYRNGIFQAATPAGISIDQLFINGASQRMARYPNYDASKKAEAYQGFAADAFSKQRAAGWADPTGGYIHAMHRARWGGYHYRITGKDDQGEVTYVGGWQNNRQMGMHKDFRMVENIFEELDSPGEWFHDQKSNTLYYQTQPDEDLDSAQVEVVRLAHLIEFNGSEKQPVRFITLQGFKIQHAARTFMQTKEPLLRSDWAIYRGGAVMVTGTENVTIQDCEFDQVGGNAVFINHYNRQALVKGCHIHDCGASGVCFVGDPDAVRDPLFEYGQKNDLATIDLTPGPKTNNYPADSRVEDCLIHGIGRVERQPAGVLIEMAQGITVRDCSVYDCARAGINVGDGCWGGHLVERCDVFDTVLETHDHGSFNSWGRDRFWRSDRSTSQVAIDKNPELPFLDATKTTTIRNNRMRCDHGWDIDLDDGSSNYDVYNNLLLNGGLKFREGFRRRAWNNITVNNGFHPHVWYNHSQDEVYANIFMVAHRGARMPTDTAKGKRVDGNLFYSADPKVKDKFVQFGWDVNSTVADPMFVDPANGDFSVKAGSPALEIGFKNFPMDQFGVKKPSLKMIAETPVIPELRVTDGDKRRARGSASAKRGAASDDSYWLGVKLHELSGEEFSAYGTRKEDGGVALPKMLADSAAAKAGLKEGDLIQAVNGQKTKTVADLLAILAQSGDTPLTLKVNRNQQATKLNFSPAIYVITETSETVEFSQLPVVATASSVVTANQGTNNDPLAMLTDGKLATGYGPVFGNGVQNGVYKMDLGAAKKVAAITSWSHNKQGARGAQKITLYGSDSPTDPGWKLNKFTPLGTIDTTGRKPAEYNATSLRARTGKTLGKFRWILWKASPVSAQNGGENTAFQEMAVEVVSD